ncbi:tachylectin-2-like [Pelobates fuscus]|uniref:tachylectin-2-like n=1 Tax=Pelobates fuscus TaxID=191477 RepID=UPI002FE494F5
MTSPDTPDTILFAVNKSSFAKAGLPPKNIMDSFDARASTVGKLNNVTKIVFSPEGELFAVCGGDLYTGSMPSEENLDWFSKARRVGKFDWNKFKFLLFNPNGLLYAVTKDGELYKGPKPDNENVSWLYGQATKIGIRSWNRFDALFFDPKGIMYAVTDDDRLVMRSPPTGPDDRWLDTSTTIGNKGWRILTHFMAFSPEGDLWCVDSNNGNIYKGRAPTKDDTAYIDKAEKLGWDYNTFPLLSFTIDKTLKSIVSFEFLPDSGKIISQGNEVVQSQIYNNKSSVPLKHTFSFSKTITETSTFTHEHGFSIDIGAEISFKTGVPFIAEGGVKISVNMSTTHTWTFTETNTTQTSFSSSSDVEVPGGKSIRMVASVTKGQMDVPYRAKIRTMFGYETYIEGIWKGVNHYDLMVTQEEYQP